MTAAEILCTVAAPGVEVVTDQTATGWETVIHGGRLDGERFASAGIRSRSTIGRVCSHTRVAATTESEFARRIVLQSRLAGLAG